jgi:hypothetical protein
MPDAGHPEMCVSSGSSGAVIRLVDGAMAMVALLVGLVLIFGWLGGDHLVGDEHNAIYFLKDGFWDYMRSFHYGQTLKAQFWTIQALFGDSFLWYRVPAAHATSGLIAWLAFFRQEGLPANRPTQALVVLVLVGNMQLLYFARWGMPNYGESILLEALLLGMLMPDLAAGRRPRWTTSRLLVIALLPWIYPATVILLGAISTYLLLRVGLSMLVAGAIKTGADLTRRAFDAAVPLLLGAGSLLLYRLTVPDAHWNRARGHHSSFKDWVDAGQGGPVSFVVNSLSDVGKDLIMLAPHQGGQFARFLTFAYAWLGWLIAASIVVALVLVLVRASRMGRALPATERHFLRGGCWLATCILASIAVVVLAQLADAFPAGGLRHVFFLIPALGLLAVISCAYLVHLIASALQKRPFLLGGRLVAALMVVIVGTLLVFTISKERRAEQQDWESLFGILRSPANDLVFSFSPGFFISSKLQPDPAHFFMTDAGSEIPGVVQQAVRAKAREPEGGRMAVLVLSNELEDSDSAINKFISKYALRLAQVARSGPYSAIVLGIPHGSVERKPESIDVTIELPDSAIASVRLDPTQFTRTPVTVDEVVLGDASGVHPIDVCGDRKLTMVRTIRIGSAGGCTLLLGNDTNTGWIAPSALRNLAPSKSPRWLRIRMTGDFNDEFKVYFDVGDGYRSAERIRIGDGATK